MKVNSPKVRESEFKIAPADERDQAPANGLKSPPTGRPGRRGRSAPLPRLLCAGETGLGDRFGEPVSEEGEEAAEHENS